MMAQSGQYNYSRCLAHGETAAAQLAAGEYVTHGADDIVYDENGEKVHYSGEQMTYAAGENKYDTKNCHILSENPQHLLFDYYKRNMIPSLLNLLSH